MSGLRLTGEKSLLHSEPQNRPASWRVVGKQEAEKSGPIISGLPDSAKTGLVRAMSVNACYRQLLAREDLVLTFLFRQRLESLDDDVASHEQGLERIGVDEIADRTLDRGLI